VAVGNKTVKGGKAGGGRLPAYPFVLLGGRALGQGLQQGLIQPATHVKQYLELAAVHLACQGCGAEATGVVPVTGQTVKFCSGPVFYLAGVKKHQVKVLCQMA